MKGALARTTDEVPEVKNQGVLRVAPWKSSYISTPGDPSSLCAPWLGAGSFQSLPLSLNSLLPVSVPCLS